MTTTATSINAIQAAQLALADARSFYEWALRHGNPGDCARGRRFIAEATAEYDAAREAVLARRAARNAERKF